MNKPLIKEALSEISVLTNMYKQTINPRVVGDFLANLATGDKNSAKVLWTGRVRDRVWSCGMDDFLVSEIDEYLECL
ncbi:hypothetical protein Barba22A_gp080 [Rheinheimera phage vB_RspM_Barba22A]|jgi:hypothetical protein|uniref:Uncharacterized protein n=85 Tax=Barbavirus TaxID=2733095 RepID=A0A7G9VRW2_9CAUD|nr:hypothetical protein HOV44_gp088 [Rheinheimera phage Barba5S]YP_009822820.1 hypothetical protein HOV45_gp084 [Rheinheimera phage Barba8S]YP_009822957.1 hypothetical protein HOV46_gp080 [Rheinheimera phage vB_RspM_Barba18A]YP_009823238.1 hypothetical protein HOV48_gp082 [Rheinheimera phage Barba21A]QCQ57931.1 hypothetical protein Barba1A_gp080 [Rheinheimera phage vB_RspM_Barba1A]QCQ58067.1 hypothetical protein Barba1S_gp080 [Rheinheimera phage vB_RspM_Barba1S]QCQ58203.1 hypothetical protein